ncbi:MAG: aminotransferase class V-fold PLP-dependent enzyme [Armatimonadota bacterium]|nr:aminotransferase class V-fold PLP-dependent enzyme [Armatimonadota bacterium]
MSNGTPFMIYLDHNATTPVLPDVREAMLPYFTDDWGNSSSSYRFGSKLKGVVEQARGQVASLISASAREVLFTGCATESNNAAIHAALKANPDKRHVITSQVEHSSVIQYCQAMEQEGYRVTYLGVDRDGMLNFADLENAIGPDTALVSLMWANNETGVLFPVQKIGELCRERGVLFHCDAVQAVGKLAVDLSKVPVDYLTLAGHKLNAPKGIGALYVRRQAPFVPYLHGGHQERGRRGGTENVALIAGFGKAAELAQKRVPNYDHTVRPLRDALESGILSSVANAELNGHKTERLPNTANISFHGIESEALLLLLDGEGICASSGSACLTDSDEPSHVVKAMKPNTDARQTVRFSLGTSNTAGEISCVVEAVHGTVEVLRG